MEQCNSLTSNNGHHRVRQASHAGSWYSDDPLELDQQLSEWLDRAGPTIGQPARAIISPYVKYRFKFEFLKFL